LLWQAKIPAGLIGVLPAGSVVCLGIDDAPFANFGSYAVHAATGQKAWTQYGDSAGPPFAAGPGAVYCTALRGVTALSTATGKVLWTTQVGLMNVGPSPVAGLYDSGTVYTSVQAGETVEGTAVALDARTGRRKWTELTPWPATAMAVADGVFYVGCPVQHTARIAELTALDGATGKRRWTTPLDTIPSQLAVTDGVVVASTALLNGSPKTFSVFALDASTGRKLWQFENKGTQAMVAADGVVYTSPDPLQAIDARTGKQLWSYQQASGTSIESGAMAVGDGVVYTAIEDSLDQHTGTMYAIQGGR
jgi:outer membrane protein assembly factor BamB